MGLILLAPGLLLVIGLILYGVYSTLLVLQLAFLNMLLCMVAFSTPTIVKIFYLKSLKIMHKFRETALGDFIIFNDLKDPDDIKLINSFDNLAVGVGMLLGGVAFLYTPIEKGILLTKVNYPNDLILKWHDFVYYNVKLRHAIMVDYEFIYQPLLYSLALGLLTLSLFYIAGLLDTLFVKVVSKFTHYDRVSVEYVQNYENLLISEGKIPPLTPSSQEETQ